MIFDRFKIRTNLKILKPKGTFSFIPKTCFSVWSLGQLHFSVFFTKQCSKEDSDPHPTGGLPEGNGFGGEW